MGNTFFMAAAQLDTQLHQYWPRLTALQKELLLTVMRSFADSADKTTPISYNEELEQALQRVRSGNFSSHEAVKEMLRNRKK